MANEVGEDELNDTNVLMKEEDENNKESGEATSENKENGEHTSDVNTNIEKNLNDRNSNLLIEIRDTGGDKIIKSNEILQDIDEPPDSFFDDLLKDDFLDSLAVVDTWNPDADDSCGSEEGHNITREEDGSNKQSTSESRRKHGEETLNKCKNSGSTSRRDRIEHQRSGDDRSRYDRKDDRRKYDRISVETKRKTRERSAERAVHRRENYNIGKQICSVDKEICIGEDDNISKEIRSVERDIYLRYKSMRDLSRERREECGKDSTEVTTSRRDKGSRDMERNLSRRARNIRERSTEKNILNRSRENKDKNIERNINRREKDKIVERSVHKGDRDKDIVATSYRHHRNSYRNRLDNMKRTEDRNERERNSGLKQKEEQRRELSPKEVTRKKDDSHESNGKEKSSEINVANREIQKAIHTENLQKQVSQGTSDIPKHGDENMTAVEAAVHQSHVPTKLSNPSINNTKLDTCIKEFDDLVPPGTEDDFKLPTRVEAVKEVDKLKVDDMNVEEKPECEIISDKDLLSEDKKKLSLKIDADKLSKCPMLGTESSNKEIYAINRMSDESKILEIDDNEGVSLSATRQTRAERVNSSHVRKRRMSGSNRLEGRKSSVSGSKRSHDDLCEARSKPLRNFKERTSSSLERGSETSRLKNEIFNERLQTKKLFESNQEEIYSRSRSREKWQPHSDPRRQKRRKDDKNDIRRSRSGSRDMQFELSGARGRMERSRSQIRQSRSGSRDKQFELSGARGRMERSRSQIRRSRSGSRSRDKQFELSGSQGRMERSRSRDRQYKTLNAEKWESHSGAQRSKRKIDLQNDSRRSVSGDKPLEFSLPERMSRSRSRDRLYRRISSNYRERRGRSRKSVSQEREKRRRSLQKSRRSQSWDKYKSKALDLSPVSVGRMPSSPSLSFELSPISSERERWRSLSRALSRERRSVRGSSFSPVSSRSACSCVSLSSLSDESNYRRRTRRKRSPFWKEMERKFAKDMDRTYSQSTMYPLPSPAETSFPEGYTPSSHPGPVTFPPSTVPYPSGPAPPYSHCYPSNPDLSGAGTQPSLSVPPPTISVPPPTLSVPPPTISVPPPLSLHPPYGPPPPLNLEHPVVPSPVPPPIYNVPPPNIPLRFTGQPPPFTTSSEFPTPENVFRSALSNTEKLQDPPQVPPPPIISQSDDDKKKMSVSSLLEASVKVGGSTKRKQKSVDPMLVVRCEEAIRTLQADDGLIFSSLGHFVLQESSRLFLPTRAALQTSPEDSNMYQSPILRIPDPQLSFTTVPFPDDAVEPSYHLPRIDVAASVAGQSQICDEPQGHHAVIPDAATSPLKPASTEIVKSYVDSSTMTVDYGDENKVSDQAQKCLVCLRRSNRIMVWNATQTPCASVKSVGIQVENVQTWTGRKRAPRNRANRKGNAVNKGNNVKSVNEAADKLSLLLRPSHSAADPASTVAVKLDSNKEASIEYKQEPPRPSISGASGNNKGGDRSEGTFYKTSTYQAYVSTPGNSSFSFYSSSVTSGGSSASLACMKTAQPNAPIPPKGILKTRSNPKLQPPLPPLQAMWQQSSPQKKTQQINLSSNFPGYSATSEPFSSSGTMRDYEDASDLCSMRRGSSSLGGMGSSSATQQGSHIPAATSPDSSFPKPGNSGLGSRDQNFFASHQNQFSPSFRGSGNPGAGHRMEQFQHQSFMDYREPSDPSMRPRNAGPRR